MDIKPYCTMCCRPLLKSKLTSTTGEYLFLCPHCGGTVLYAKEDEVREWAQWKDIKDMLNDKNAFKNGVGIEWIKRRNP